MLSVYTLENSKEWDEKVASFVDCDTYWLSGYTKAFKNHGDGEPILFHYDDGQTRGINVVMKRDIAEDVHFVGRLHENEYFDFATPYGYGGWIIEGEQPEKLFRVYEAWCVENNIVSEFVRFHPVVKNYRFAVENYDVVLLGKTVAMDISSPEKIWENMTSKNRNMVRKAEKNGITIHRGRNSELFETFRQIYNATMDKDNASEYYYFSSEFYESILNDLSEEAQVFYALYDEKIIAAAIVLCRNDKLNYHLSGSVKERQNLAPSNLLLYKAALWGCENGCKTFHLGGGVGSGEDSLFRFKKSFYRGEDLPQFHIGKKIFDKKKYDRLLSMREDLEGNSFFPEYRA